MGWSVVYISVIELVVLHNALDIIVMFLCCDHIYVWMMIAHTLITIHMLDMFGLFILKRLHDSDASSG